MECLLYLYGIISNIIYFSYLEAMLERTSNRRNGFHTKLLILNYNSTIPLRRYSKT